jgi:diguanylate cyclase
MQQVADMENLQLISSFSRSGELSLNHYTTHSPIANREKLELLESLMSQEKLADLLQTFAAWVANQLPVCRMAYHFMTRRMKLLDSMKRGQKQSFTLQDSQMQYLGQLDYELQENLDQQQQRKLQQLHQLLAQPLRLFLRMEQMDMQSRMDHLTGIGNRAFFDESLPRAIQQNLRSPDGLTLVLLDLDRFKQINDTHGHPVGDKVLKEFADILTRSVRGTDQAFRLGGDEFALLLQPADEDAATRVQARINYHLLNNPELQPLKVGSSLGFARWSKGMNAQELYALADQQLYRHKRSQG